MSEFNQQDSIVQEMIPKFQTLYGAPATIAGRAPGRVNLIGEHIDYCGFAVFPMALEGKHTTVLARLTETGQIRVRNTDPEHYPNEDVASVDASAPLAAKNTWAQYCEAAVKQYCLEAGYIIKGVDLLVHGLVPIASGLSSSAALLCAIASALDVAQGMPHIKQGLVHCTVEAEHRVGMNCGGMDQSISIYGQKGYACVIGFCPPSVKPVKLPEAHFVVAHCMERAAKLEGYDTNCYNHRVLEVRRAAELMKDGCKTIGEVVKAVGGFDPAIELANKLPETEGNLVLRDRALHVLTEARRVLQMEGASLEEWGKLMCQSHESCSKLYHCSCDALDELVADGMAAGAIGGRLTGAGWGGCTIFMLKPSDDPNAFIQKLKDTYYKKHNVENPIVFATSPGEGAHAFKIE
ncbi:galactokinase family protein [Tritrichomonas foetus]|uniref:Galactokinase family protein n=1 Tax=Tritrichomonas foetus TaxID=1144522 RepID=A0A1J4K3D4_9EUKA|nr:galactokinase family protein [Tritrichomonas foetus]|eukprot:OHT05953.1 galactokinase family protein [Tritrichomonas foetus]